MSELIKIWSGLNDFTVEEIIDISEEYYHYNKLTEEDSEMVCDPNFRKLITNHKLESPQKLYDFLNTEINGINILDYIDTPPRQKNNKCENIYNPIEKTQSDLQYNYNEKKTNRCDNYPTTQQEIYEPSYDDL